MIFQKLSLRDIDAVRPFFTLQSNRLCDNTTGTAVMWRDSFYTHFAIEEGALFFQVLYGRKKLKAYTVPLARDKRRALESLKTHFEQTGDRPLFCAVSKEDIPLIEQVFGEVEVRAERQWFDYLYSAEDMATFRGRKFNGQRNHVNRFKKQYPLYSVTDIDDQNAPRLADFLKDYTKKFLAGDEGATEEASHALEVLENFSLFGLFGAFIEVEGEIVAFSIGEKVNDTMFIHIEKALTSYRGAYQMMVHEFAKRFVTPDILYINREDDVGDEGLRQSKLSYHPVALLEKHLVWPKNNEEKGAFAE